MGDHCTEGSGTAKVGTDEQEPHTEAIYGGKGNTTYRRLQPTTIGSRCGRYWPKDYALTGGGLRLGLVFLYAKKSAEAIVVADTSCEKKSQRSHKTMKGRTLYCSNTYWMIKLNSFQATCKREQRCIRWKERVHWYATNRRIRDPYVRWCERFSDRLLAYRLPTRLCIRSSPMPKDLKSNVL